MSEIIFGEHNKEGSMISIDKTCWKLFAKLSKDKEIRKVTNLNNNVFDALTEHVSKEDSDVQSENSETNLSETDDSETSEFLTQETDVAKHELLTQETDVPKHPAGWFEAQRMIAIEMIGSISTQNEFGMCIDIDNNHKLLKYMKNGEVKKIKRELELVYENLNYTQLNPLALNKSINDLKLTTSVLEYRMKLQDLVNKYNIVASNKLVDSALCDKIRWNGLANNQPNTLTAYLCKATSIEKLINFKIVIYYSIIY